MGRGLPRQLQRCGDSRWTIIDACLIHGKVGLLRELFAHRRD